MKKITFAGSGDLIENLIDKVKDEWDVSVVLSKRMPESGLFNIRRKCKAEGIPYQ